MGGDPFEKGGSCGSAPKSVPLTFVLTSDLAAYLAAAVDADVVDGERIDIGWTRPVSMQDLADIASRVVGAPIGVRAVPVKLIRALGLTLGRFDPMVRSMGAMFDWFATGKYVADTSRQAEVFGPVPTPEDAVARYARVRALRGRTTGGLGAAAKHKPPAAKKPPAASAAGGLEGTAGLPRAMPLRRPGLRPARRRRP